MTQHHAPLPSASDLGELEASPRRRGRPVGDQVAARANLISAAITVIAKEGFGGASLRKVAEHAGCTTGALTYYFSNKEEMVAAVAESLWDTWDEILKFPGEEGDIRTTLERWLEWTGAEDADPW